MDKNKIQEMRESPPKPGLPCDEIVQRKMLVKSKETTDPKYGSSPEKLGIKDYISRGVINLDKPANPTSHQVSAWVKKILNANKVGHGGTLDPKVTGILPLTILEATRIVQALLSAGKEYVCVMRLHGGFSEEKLRQVCGEFVGKIYQRPPLRSSVKRRMRVREVYYLEILEIEGHNVLLRIGCQAGTYARKLCNDIGEALGCGAHMRELRRTRVGYFREDETLVTLQDLKDAYVFWKEDRDETELRRIIRPLEHGLIHLPKVIIRDSAVDALCHGADLAAPGVVILHEKMKPEDRVAVFTQKGEAVALSRAVCSSEEIMEMDHGIIATAERVLMKRGTYPKSWKEKNCE